jgi:hypothetical protein
MTRTVNPEVAGSSPVEPAIKSQSEKAVTAVAAFTLPGALPSCLRKQAVKSFHDHDHTTSRV